MEAYITPRTTSRHRLKCCISALLLLLTTNISQASAATTLPQSHVQIGDIIANTQPEVTTANAISYDFVPVASGLAEPWFMAHTGDTRLFVVERRGKVRIVNNRVLSPTPFLDLSNVVNATGEEQGLISIAFEPNYALTGRFYVLYTVANNDVVIARYSVSGNPDIADATSAKPILTVPHPNHKLHNGGWMAFGKDSNLYISTGDGSGSKDVFCSAQNLQDLRGKLLRINVIGQNTYLSPPENTFNTAPSGASAAAKPAPEIFAFGLRNPRRASFDRKTDDLYVGDVGEFLREEISLLPAGSKAGANFGWSKWEGSQAYVNTCANTNIAPTQPILEYTAAQGTRVIGGYVYRGSQFPWLDGLYFYGDSGSGRVWAAQAQPNGSYTSTLIADTNFVINTFGEDVNGELYVADYATGKIYRLNASSTQIPRAQRYLPLLSQNSTGNVISATPTTTATAIATTTITVTATLIPSTPAGPATNTTSRYVKSINEQRQFDMGCVAGRQGESGLTILAFGRAHQQGNEFGTVIYDGLASFANTSQISTAIKSFMRGYVNCVNKTSLNALRVAVGTSNFFLDKKGNFVTREHGIAWASMVNEIGDWVKANPAIASRVSVAGASDMELSWNSVSATRAWMDGYASAYQYPIYNFGSCDSCPYNARPNISPANGWGLDDVLYISWAAKPAFSVPEIYLLNGINAEQWARLSLYSYTSTGKPITYTGALTQWMSCHDTQEAECADTGNTPAQGQRQLLAALNSDARTVQRELKWNSDIGWNDNLSILQFNVNGAVNAGLAGSVDTVNGPPQPPAVTAADPAAVAIDAAIAAKVQLEQAAERQIQQARLAPPQAPSAVRVDGRGGGSNDIVVPITNVDRRSGGSGTIIDDGQAPLPGQIYRMANRWVWQTNGKTVIAYAGARNSLSGEAMPQGVVVISVQQIDSAGQLSEQLTHQHFASAGQLRIVTEAGSKLILHDEAGTQFELDLSALTLVTPTPAVTPPVTTPVVSNTNTQVKSAAATPAPTRRPATPAPASVPTVVAAVKRPAGIGGGAPSGGGASLPAVKKR